MTPPAPPEPPPQLTSLDRVKVGAVVVWLGDKYLVMPGYRLKWHYPGGWDDSIIRELNSTALVFAEAKDILQPIANPPSLPRRRDIDFGFELDPDTGERQVAVYDENGNTEYMTVPSQQVPIPQPGPSEYAEVPFALADTRRFGDHVHVAVCFRDVRQSIALYAVFDGRFMRLIKQSAGSARDLGGNRYWIQGDTLVFIRPTHVLP